MKTIDTKYVSEKSDPPSKNRVGDFLASTTSTTSATWLQVPELHQEIETTDTTTVSGVCRFLSKDPIGISGGLNQYVFCGNNPGNRRDPLGLAYQTVCVDSDGRPHYGPETNWGSNDGLWGGQGAGSGFSRGPASYGYNQSGHGTIIYSSEVAYYAVLGGSGGTEVVLLDSFCCGKGFGG